MSTRGTRGIRGARGNRGRGIARGSTNSSFIPLPEKERENVPTYPPTYPPRPPRISPKNELNQKTFNNNSGILDFEKKVIKATKTIKKITELNSQLQNISLLQNIKHKYQEKFTTLEQIGKITLQSIKNILLMFLDKNQFIKIINWCNKEKYSISFESHFIYNESHSYFPSTKTHQLKLKFEFGFIIYPSHKKQETIKYIPIRIEKTFETKTPYKKLYFSSFDSLKKLDMSWFFKHFIDDNLNLDFKINQDSKTCKTPRRNEEINKSIDFFIQFHEFFIFYENHLQKFINNFGEIKIDEEFEYFIPIFPFLKENSNNFQESEIKLLLDEQNNDIQLKIDKYNKLNSSFSSCNSLFIFSVYFCEISQRFIDCCNYIEYLSFNQLHKVIGHIVKKKDVFHVLNYSLLNLFKDQYKSNIFSYSIRNNYENINQSDSIGCISLINNENQKILCFTNSFQSYSFSCRISNSLQLKMNGKCYIHGWINGLFEETEQNDDFPYIDDSSVKLVIQGQNFTNFIVVIGVLSSSSEFIPKKGILIHGNSMLIPLLIHSIPTRKEFEDLTKSLSKEQKEFANLYRNMQLEGNTMIIATIPIQNQLEKILNLHKNSLNKEIELQNEIIELLTKYNIPPHLLRLSDIDCEFLHTNYDKINKMKQIVNELKEMIRNIKKDQIYDEKLKHQIDEKEIERRNQLKIKLKRSLEMDKIFELLLEVLPEDFNDNKTENNSIGSFYSPDRIIPDVSFFPVFIMLLYILAKTPFKKLNIKIEFF